MPEKKKKNRGGQSALPKPEAKRFHSISGPGTRVTQPLPLNPGNADSESRQHRHLHLHLLLCACGGVQCRNGGKGPR